ncbi:MAG: hypothetical protein JSS69_05910, partial [Acidobacteria bacterium]|nr:hypothetical protein [Acidobacteriota bacterium]
MVRILVLLSFFLVFGQAERAQTASDPVALAIERGDLYQSKHKYDLALVAYQTADKLAHHQSAACILKIAIVEKKLGDFSSALDDTKKAIK